MHTNGRAQHAFSVDVEDYFQVSAFEGQVRPEDWPSMPSRVERNTERLLDKLAEHEVRATFFVLGWVAEHYPGVVRRIADAGHEIGCHGYSHRKIYTQNDGLFREETHRAKALLEDLAGAGIKGYRAASFSITEQSLWALDVIAEEGFAYDSSIYPIWHDNYGIPGAARTPSCLTAPSGGSLVEFPLSTVRMLGTSLPVGGGGYFRLYPYWLTRKLLNRVQDAGEPINFYCHPWEIDSEQPRFENAPWKSRFRHYNNIDRFERRLDRLLSEFRFTSCSDVLTANGLLHP